MKVKLDFKLEYCKSCELCLSACPSGVLAICKDSTNSRGYYPVTAVNIEACTACSCCAKMCPDSVISISIE